LWKKKNVRYQDTSFKGQQQVFNFMKNGKLNNEFPDVQRISQRILLWLEDIKGGTNKNDLIK